MRNLFPLFVAIFVLSVVACRNSSDDSGDGDAGATDAGLPDGAADAIPPDLNQLTQPWALITAPTGRRTYTTTASSLSIGGPGFADEVTWTTDRGTSGTTTATGHWEVTVPLEIGDNVIDVMASTSGVSDTLTVTRNAYVAFDGPVEYFPKAVFVNDASSVTFRVSIPYSDDVFPMDVVVVRLDDDLQVTDELCHLVDDGNQANGDREPGDLEYACVHSFNEATDGLLKLRVVVDNIGPNGAETALSEIFELHVVTPVTQLELDRVESIMDGVKSEYDQALPQGDVAAAEATLAWLQSQADVQEAGRSQDGYTVWWELIISGGRRLRMGFGGGAPGTRGGPQVRPSKGLILEPYYADWLATNDEISEEVEDNLEQARCPLIDPIRVYHEGRGLAGVESFKTMGEHGVVFINSHGSTIYQTIITADGTQTVDLHSVILTDQLFNPSDNVSTPGSPGRYSADIVESGSTNEPAPILIWQRRNGEIVYALTSSFIDKYVSFDRAIVFSGACYGLDDTRHPDPAVRVHALSARILKAGAGAFVAFYGPVANRFGGDWAKQYVGELVNGLPAGPAFYSVALDLGVWCPGNRCEAKILTNQPDDWFLELCWGCDGYWRRHIVYESDDYSYNGLMEVQHRIQQGELGEFGASELRAVCRVSMDSKTTLAPGVYLYDSYLAAGIYEQVFDEPYPFVFSIEPDDSAVTFWSGAFPDDSSWVFRADSSSAAPSAFSQVDCEVVREVYETYDTASGEVSITSESMHGNMFETSSGGGTTVTSFEYRLQP